MRAEPVEGSAGAGHFAWAIRVTPHRGVTCELRGYPGVSLVDAAGRQLGAAADRDSGSAPDLRLESPRSAVATVLVTQAANYAPACTIVESAGWRVYLPDQFDAVTVPARLSACVEGSIHLLRVRPFAVG